MTTRARVLFICTHNSARSQMAEAYLNRLGVGRFEAQSAGTEPGALNPLAVQVMAEEGIDISAQRAKPIDDFVPQRFDYVITVCDHANETCPVFPNARRRLHWSFPDPSQAEGTLEERLSVFRAIRDAIRVRVEESLVAAREDSGPVASQEHSAGPSTRNREWRT